MPAPDDPPCEPAEIDPGLAIRARNAEVAQFRALSAFVNRFAPALCPVADGSPVDESGLDDDLVGARSLAVTVAFQALRKLAQRWATADPLGGTL